MQRQTSNYTACHPSSAKGRVKSRCALGSIPKSRDSTGSFGVTSQLTSGTLKHAEIQILMRPTCTDLGTPLEPGLCQVGSGPSAAAIVEVSGGLEGFRSYTAKQKTENDHKLRDSSAAGESCFHMPLMLFLCTVCFVLAWP